MLSFDEFTLKYPSAPFNDEGIEDKKIRSRKRNIHSATQHRERKKRYISYLRTNAEDFKKKYEEEKRKSDSLRKLLVTLEENRLPDIVEETIVSDDEFESYLKEFYGNN